MNACPDADTLLRFLEGELDTTEDARIVAHVEGCGGCQGLLERLTGPRPWAGDETTVDATCNEPGPAARHTDIDHGEAYVAWGEDTEQPFGASRTVDRDNRRTETAVPHDAPSIREPSVRAAGPSPDVPGYDILQRLGEGGMGVVYRARHRGLNRLVALKMIRGGSQARLDFFPRFRVEAESVARLRHPNIIQIYDIGEAGGLPFVALELLDGGSLDARLAGNPQPGKTSAELMMILARAVHVAHEGGIIHRDLKPGNVLYTTDGVPKITDFGLAKRVDSDEGHTQDDQILGSPSYMSPEQARGHSRNVGPAADIYALGAILYEMLTGRPPFKGGTPMETVRQVIDDDPVTPSRLVPRLPRDLETICLKCLHKDPARRYGSARALADDLKRYLDGVPIMARRTPAWERGAKWARRRPFAALAATSLVAAIPVSFFLVLESQHRRNRLLLEEHGRIMTLHADGTQRLLRAREELARNDLTGAQVSATGLKEKIEGETPLAGLLAAADELLREVKRRQAEQASRESDRARYGEFIRLRDDALFHETRFTGLGLSDNREATRRAARAALELYAAPGGGDSWRLSPVSPSLTPQEQSEVVEGCYGLLLILAGTEPGPDRALRRLDEAGRLHPPTRAYHLRRAACLAQAGDRQAADRERRAAERLEPVTAFDHFLAGQERFARRDFDAANQEFDMALQLQPDYFWAQALSAVCWLELNQPVEARAGLNACLQREKRFAWLYILRGFASGQIAGIAREVMGKNPDSGGRVDRLYAAADSDYRRAQELLDDGSDAGLRYALFVNRGVLRLTLRRDLDQAVEHLRAAIRLEPRGFEAQVALAKVHQSQDRAEEAAEQYGRAIALRPREAELYRERSRTELRRKGPAAERHSRALNDLEQAIRLDEPGSAELARDQVRRARVLVAGHREAEAIAACDEAIKVVPDDEEAHRLRLDLLFRLKKYDDIIRSCNPLIARRKASAGIYERRALAREQVRDFAGAVEDFTTALALSGDRPRLLRLRGRVYQFIDAPRLALHDFQEAILLEPSSGDAHYGRGLARLRLGEYRDAIADAERAVTIGEPTADLFYKSARVYAMAAVTVSAEVRKKGRDSVLLATRYNDRAADLLREAILRMPADRRDVFVKEVILADPDLRALRRRFSSLDLAGPISPRESTARPSPH